MLTTGCKASLLIVSYLYCLYYAEALRVTPLADVERCVVGDIAAGVNPPAQDAQCCNAGAVHCWKCFPSVDVAIRRITTNPLIMPDGTIGVYLVASAYGAAPAPTSANVKYFGKASSPSTGASGTTFRGLLAETARRAKKAGIHTSWLCMYAMGVAAAPDQLPFMIEQLVLSSFGFSVNYVSELGLKRDTNKGLYATNYDNTPGNAMSVMASVISMDTNIAAKVASIAGATIV